MQDYKKLNMRSTKGFTLIELMIVVAVLAILASIAYSGYSAQTTKTRRSAAQSTLVGLAQAMERHKTSSGTYVTAITGSAPQPPDIYPSQSPLDGSIKFYDLTVQAVTATSYTLRATPIAGGGQDGDGILELDSTGVRYWDRDGNGSRSAAEMCWQTTC